MAVSGLSPEGAGLGSARVKVNQMNPLAILPVVVASTRVARSNAPRLMLRVKGSELEGPDILKAGPKVEL